MDDHRFDHFAKTLAVMPTRRGFLKTLAGVIIAAGSGLDLAPLTAASGVCDPQLAAKCVRDATDFYRTQQTECRGLLRSDPTDPAHSAQLMFACLAGAEVEYKRELGQCQYQPCDLSNCEHCVNGSCQSTCPDGVSCVGGQCAGCPGDQHKCGSDCCLSDQACCNHVCCPPGVTACDATTGACLTCSAQNCPNGCCDSQGNCQSGTDPAACGGGGGACAVCGSNDVCQNQTCQTQSCLISGQTCGSDAQCCSSSCVSNVCCQPQNAACAGGCCGGLSCDPATNTCLPPCAAGMRRCDDGTCHQCCANSDCGTGQICQNGVCQAQSSCDPCCGVIPRECACDTDTGGTAQCFAPACQQDGSGSCLACGAGCPSGTACWRNDQGQEFCRFTCSPSC